MISFRITAGEWDFARKHKDRYHILRVLRVGKPNMTVIKLSNPHQLALQGSISLFLDMEKNLHQALGLMEIFPRHTAMDPDFHRPDT